jgi:hypothetical protein
MRTIICLIFCVCPLLLVPTPSTACTKPPGFGFVVRVNEVVYQGGLQIYQGYMGNIWLGASWQKDQPGAAGNNRDGEVQTSTFGLANFSNYRTPADYLFWISRDNPRSTPCFNDYLVDPATNKSVFTMQPSSDPFDTYCNVQDPPLTATPSRLTGGTQTKVTVTGASVPTTYGPALVQVLQNTTGNQLFSGQITPVNGTFSVNITAPDSKTQTTGILIVRSQNHDGTYTAFGSARLTFTADAGCVGSVCP